MVTDWIRWRGIPRSASIIINNYNYEAFLRAAIESALRQTRPAQVLVVDDGSEDCSVAIIRSFGDQIEAIFKPNGGQASAMNEGFARAQGDLVIFLDSDDLLEPTAVESLLSSWKPGSVLVQYPLTIIDAENVSHGIYPDPPKSGLAEGDVRPQLLATGSFPVNVTSGLAFSRSALLEIMPIPKVYRNAADGYLARGVAFLGQVQRLEAPLGCYRKHGRNDSDVCAAPGGMAEGFRKKIRYAESEFTTTRQFAERFGLSVVSNIGEQDAWFLGYRLFSLLLEPESHPIPNDRRWPLLGRYIKARWRSGWPLHRRLMATVLATVACVGTRHMRSTAIRWLHDSSSRPNWFRALSSRRA